MDRERPPRTIALHDGLPDEEALELAVATLMGGGLVALPTDTVYGLCASPDAPAAVERIYEAKGRDRAKPLARLVSSASVAAALADKWPRLARKLARAYWPGALTIVSGELGLRMCEHRFARHLAGRMGGSIIATSANLSGGPEPVTAQEVAASLGGAIDLIIDGGRTAESPSTVARVDGSRIEILREGAVAPADIIALAPPKALIVCRGNTCRSPLAAALMKREFARRGRTEVEVVSAGLDVVGGPEAKASSGAVEAAMELDLDISGHRAAALSPGLLTTADWVYVMERDHLSAITSFLPEEHDHVQLLDPAGGDIIDPAGLGPDAYRVAAARIRVAAAIRAEQISAALETETK